ncbi:MAG: hypothetical protein R8G66_18865 [Cytophagales bacterium]|nr:hypothetical protein [Cytophagales bacterium]
MINRGKIIRILGWSLLLLTAVIACKEEAEPTMFQGQVVFADDNEPFLNGYIEFTAGSDGASGKLADFRELPLEAKNGAFEIIFDANEDIVSFNIEVSDTVFFDVIGPEDGLDCGAIPCEEISPGNDYRNLIIRVPR